ncbi:MAG: DUF4363 family protein [Clostridia bacterium]|nr:DUF4363 family protein [Clostridia bacterium]
MRSAIVSLILLAAIVTASVICNSIIDNMIDGIIAAADELPALPDDRDGILRSADKMEKEWKKAKRFASVGAADSHIEKIDKDIIRIRTYCKTKQNGGYMSAVDLLKYDLRKLQSVYRFELANVF